MCKVSVGLCILLKAPMDFKNKRNDYRSLHTRLFFRILSRGKVSMRKLINAAWCTVAYHLKLSKSAPSPVILSLELWNECNAGCLFCRDKKGRIYDFNPKSSSQSSIEKGKMPKEVAFGVIDQLKKDVLVAVLYTNGEPLLYQDLPEVISSATKNNVATIISTNGLLFTETNAKAILESGIDLIKIQLSGFTQDIYSVQIRYGHIEKLKENIRMVAKINRQGNYGAIILVDYILYNYNRHQLELVRSFCHELGVIMNVRPGNPKGGLEEKEPPLKHAPLPLKMSCDWLWKGMQINWNGEVLQCCDGVVWNGIEAYDTFRINKTDLKKVWNGSSAATMRQRITKKGRGDIPICSQCTRVGVSFKW